MIKAIIFDCFGVLATDGWLPFRDEYFADNSGLLARADDLNREMNTGLISYPSFLRQVAKLANVSEELLDKRIDSNVPNTKLISFIQKQLKPRYKIGMLSNAGANWLEVIFTKPHLAIFDAVVLSYEIGAIKPDPRVYEIIAEKLGVDIDSCVFIDDQQRHCIGAQQVGMQAIQYTDFQNMKAALAKLLL